MKNYTIEIAILDGDGQRWVPKGTIRGKSMPRILRRAYYENFTGRFETHNQVGNTLMHNKYPTMPVLRLVEISS
jgi:hypothetical protein